MAIRAATGRDVERMVGLSGEVRSRLEQFDAIFWRRHAAAETIQQAWFQRLLTDADHGVFVVDHEPGGLLEGFVVARIMDAPPVFDPGGRTCMVDDWAWTREALAQPLLDHALAWGRTRGATQAVVVTAAADHERRALLTDAGLVPTSEWWVRQIDSA